MKTTIRIAALLTAVSLVSGCTNGLRLRDRQSGAVKLPAAPTLDAGTAEAGTVGSPVPRPPAMAPSASPFDGS